MYDLSRRLAVRTRSRNSFLCRLYKMTVIKRKEMHRLCIYFSNQKNMQGSFELLFIASL